MILAGFIRCKSARKALCFSERLWFLYQISIVWDIPPCLVFLLTTILIPVCLKLKPVFKPTVVGQPAQFLWTWTTNSCISSHWCSFFLPTWAVLNPLLVDYCMGWYYPLYILDDHNPWEIRSKATIFERDDNLLQPYEFELVSWLSENGGATIPRFLSCFSIKKLPFRVCAPFSDTFHIFFFGKCWRVSHFGWRFLPLPGPWFQLKTQTTHPNNSFQRLDPFHLGSSRYFCGNQPGALGSISRKVKSPWLDPFYHHMCWWTLMKFPLLVVKSHGYSDIHKGNLNCPK